jgi:hypothetical protein
MAPLKIDPDWSEEVAYYQLSFEGLGGYFEYILLKNYRYEVSFPLQLISVMAKGEAFDINNRPLVGHDTLSHRFGMMSLGATGSYNFNYWVAISLGFGYRFSLKNYGEQTDPLNTPFYSFGFKIQLGKLYQTVFHHEKVLHLKSIYFRESKPEKSRDLMNRSKQISQRKASKRND